MAKPGQKNINTELDPEILRRQPQAFDVVNPGVDFATLDREGKLQFFKDVAEERIFRPRRIDPEFATEFSQFRADFLNQKEQAALGREAKLESIRSERGSRAEALARERQATATQKQISSDARRSAILAASSAARQRVSAQNISRLAAAKSATLGGSALRTRGISGRGGFSSLSDSVLG